jgi:anti-sigma factor RsiW
MKEIPENVAIGHLGNDQLLRALDDELPAAEASCVEEHLAVCEECKGRYREFGGISVRLERFVSATPSKEHPGEREELARQFREQDAMHSKARRAGSVRGRAGWSIAIAAGLVFALLFLPRTHSSVVPNALTTAGMPQTFEVAGETFVALPYSDAELSMSAPHIVEMQVPVSSLAEAGVLFEPVSSEQANPDRAVLADVLFGLDGEPLGVHVIGAD